MGIVNHKEDIAVYIENQELIANKYVMKCFSVTMLLYFITFLLNLLGVFIIDQRIMLSGFIPSLLIYILVYIVTGYISLTDRGVKYFILCSVIVVYTIMGVFITYHVVLASLLPFLYAALYSSKKVLRYVYGLTVISTIVVVYAGYYVGLCDANMLLLTSGRMQDYISGGQLLQMEINSNPAMSLMLFFVIPRCLIYIAFAFVCTSLFHIVSGSLEKAKLTAELQKAKDEAERANQAKTKFLAEISHEIRTPVNTVLGMNEMVLRESGEETIRGYAKDIKHSSMALLHIINELLDATKIESGKKEVTEDDESVGDSEEGLSQDFEEEYRTGFVAPDARVLVVDDNEFNLKVFSNLLKDTGMQIYEAESGKDCIELLKHRSFHLVFLDHMMPEMDGIETFREIKKQKICENTPIIMLTANAIIGDREKYLEEGFDDFLSKPIIPEELDSMVLKYLPRELVQSNCTQNHDVPDNETQANCLADAEGKIAVDALAAYAELCNSLPEFDFERGLTTCSNDVDFYLELFADFTGLGVKAELEYYLKTNNYKDYSTRVHGFKNNAYSIGATQIGDLAYTLEKLTKDGMAEEVYTLQEQLFQQYDRVCDIYKGIIRNEKID